MSEKTSEETVAEILSTDFIKVLFVPPTYGELRDGVAAVTCDFGLERAVIQIFKEAGFSIRIGEFKEDDNPNALGIHVDSLPFAENISQHYKYYRLLDRKALKIGAEMPKEFHWTDILKTDTPIIAKWRGADGGILNTI